MTNIEVRVGSNGTAATLKGNGLCDKSFAGPASAGVDFVVAFVCQNTRGRFVTVQKTSTSTTLSIAHVKIDTGPIQGFKMFLIVFTDLGILFF